MPNVVTIVCKLLAMRNIWHIYYLTQRRPPRLPHEEHKMSRKNMSNTIPKYLRPAEAEKIFGVKKSQIYGAGRGDYTGPLPRPFRVGATLFIDSRELEACLERAKANR